MTLSGAPPRLSACSSSTPNCPLRLNDASGCAALQHTETSAGCAGTCIDLDCSHSVLRLSSGSNSLYYCSMITGHPGLWVGVGPGHIKMTSSIKSPFKQWHHGTEGLVATPTRDRRGWFSHISMDPSIVFSNDAAVLTGFLTKPTCC